ncbi:MAG: Ig-like domain-containing protein [Paludibacteraceae bacterium]|nr:Ig-like domain-containing protein [Paludibacteraceae bacterium]
MFTDGEPTANRQRIDSECCRGLTDGRPTVEYAVQHTLRYAFLLLTFTLMVSTNAWGYTFQGNEVFYMDRVITDENGNNTQFLGGDNPRCDFNFYNGSEFIGGVRGTLIDDNKIIKFAVPSDWRGKTADKVKAKRINEDGSGDYSSTYKDVFNYPTNNYVKASGTTKNHLEWGTYTEQGGGDEPTTKTFKGGEVFYMKQNTIAKDGQSHDFMKYDRCDFNLYDANGSFLNKALSAEKIPNTDPAMLKFVVPAEYAGTVWAKVKVKQLETGGKGHNETQQGDIPTDGKNYLINGNTWEWGTYTEPLPWSSDTYQTWYLTGDFTKPGEFDRWDNPTSYTFTDVDAYHKQVTIKNLDPNNSQIFSNQNGHKLTRFEIVKGDWNDPRINKPHFDAAGSNCVLMEDWKSPYASSTRMVVELTQKSDITFDIWRSGTGDADRRVTITITPSTEPEPDPTLQPWSGDSYKEWWLTGDFTCTQKNYFDGWANPTDKKFTLSQDGLHQTVTIQLDPATDDETKIHNNNGHYLTRFEIVSGGWNTGNPRINKPQFDSDGSNCSLQTDWKESGSNRMTFELTQKSDITFDIWRLGTSASNAERKVTVTITPIEQFTVAFNDGNTQLSSQQVYSGEHPTKPTDPSKTGYRFLGWSETDGGNVVDVTTVTITSAKTFYAKWIQQFEVTFNTDGGSTAPEKQTIDKGSKVTEPADPTKSERIFVAWQKNGVNYDFNAGVTESFELKATWKEYPLTGVSLNKSEVELKKNEQVTLTTTHNPTYAGIQTSQWSSDHPEIASVENGTVTAVAVGTATITYSATDKEGNTKTATCAITVSSGKAKPTFTWVMDGSDFNTTVYPGAMYQISVEANSMLPTLAISGVGTLSNEVVSGKKVSYILSIPADATGSFTLTASTTETDDYDVAANVQNMTVATCSREDVKMYEFVMSDRTAQTDIDVDGGKVSYDAMFDNTGIPATCRIVKLKFNNSWYAHVTKVNEQYQAQIIKNDGETSKWYEIPVGSVKPNWVNKTYTTYRFMNVATGQYLCRGNGMYGGGDWGYYVTTAIETPSGNNCNWFYDDTKSQHLVCQEGMGNDLKKSFMVNICNIDGAGQTFSAHPQPELICSNVPDPSGNVWTKLIDAVQVEQSVTNPEYKQASFEVNGKTYYRFANNTSKIITALGNSETLAEGDKVTLYIYNAGAKASAANIQLLAGNDVAYTFTDEVAASTTAELTYTIPAESKLIGANVSVRPSNTDICFSTIKLMRPVDPSTFPTPTFTWSEDVTNLQKVYEEGTFKITATPSIVSDVTYSSSNEGIATVAADGTVTPKAVGTVTITASTAQTDCFNAGHASYEVEIITNLTVPTFTFTVPEAIYQGSKHAISVTSNSDQAISLELLNGSTGVTLKDVVPGVGSATATLEFAGNATSATLRATTAASTTCAAGVKEQLYAVVGCYPDGRDLYEFTMTNEIDATNTADGGTISYSKLNAEVPTIKVKFYNDNNSYLRGQKPFMADDGSGYVVGTLEATDGSDLWYPIATGETFKGYDLFYLKNVKTGNYIRRGTDASKKDGSWGNYNAEVVAQQQTSDEFKWFFDTTSKGTHLGCYAGAYGDNHDSEFKNTYCIQTDNWLRPNSEEYANCQPTKLICGRPGDPDRVWTKVDTKTEGSALDPDNIVTLNLNEALKEGDTISVKVHNSSSSALGATSKVRIYTAAGALVKEFDAALSGKTNVTYKYTLGSSDALAGVTSVVIRHTDLNLHFDNFKVFRPQEGEFIQPALTWDNIAADATLTLNMQMTSTMTHVATANVTTVSTITYSSSDESVATVDANTGEVTATLTSGVKTVTITATQAGIGCYKEAKVTYNIQVYNTTLQDLVDAAEETLTLPCDFTDNITIEKKLTIDAKGNKIGNLTITNTGDLTLASAMTAKDFIIEADQSAQQSAQQSGQLKGANLLTVTGNAYCDVTFASEQVTEGWYAFTVPFTVDAINGVYWGEKKLKNETDYAIMQYQGDVRAQGKYGWIKVQKKGGKLNAGQFYVITLGDTDYNTMRFMMTKGTDLAAATSMNVYEYASAEDGNAGWNGVGNPNLYHATAAINGITKMQTYNHTNDAFKVGLLDESHVVGTPFFVQSNGDKTMTTSVAEVSKAPARMLAAATAGDEFTIDLELDGMKQDRIFLSASEEASATYEIGHDLTKMTLGTAKVAQVAINGYGMSLCDAEFVLDDNNEAVFPLTITTPKAGEYTLSIKRACENQSVFVMDGNQVVWDLTQGDYTLSLAKGTSSNYSLLLQAAERQMPTGNQQLKANGEDVQKIILHNALRIIKNGKMYNVLGL